MCGRARITEGGTFVVRATLIMLMVSMVPIFIFSCADEGRAAGEEVSSGRGRGDAGSERRAREDGVARR